MSFQKLLNPSKSESAPRLVKLPHHRLRSLASTLLSLHRTLPPPSLPTHPLTVVCISDTHGTRPPIPPGDLLLHAGDLSRWCTFSEIQAQITWLSGQPYKYKVVIAGNHDLLLDPKFKEQYLWRGGNRLCKRHPTISTSSILTPLPPTSSGEISYISRTHLSLSWLPLIAASGSTAPP